MGRWSTSPRTGPLAALAVLLALGATFAFTRPAGRADTITPAPGGPEPALAVAYAAAPQPPREINVPAGPDHPAYTVYTPGGPAGAQPSPIAVVALHGMGGTGPGIAAPILPFARAQGWTVIAPTISYGDWRDPTQLTNEELVLEPQLAAMLDDVPAETGVSLPPQVLLFGFSRGAQSALRFSMLYPERVLGVAACSAGTYTLPETAVKSVSGATMSAPLPYGVADAQQRLGRAIDPSALSGVRYLIGVGAQDKNEGDVPRQWDPYVGKSRLERAQRFSADLSRLGLSVQTVVVPDTGHELSGPMIDQVTGFLGGVAADALAQQSAPAAPPPAPTAAPSAPVRRA